MIHPTSSSILLQTAFLNPHTTRVTHDAFAALRDKPHDLEATLGTPTRDTSGEIASRQNTDLQKAHRSVADIERALQNIAGFLATPQTQFDAQQISQNKDHSVIREEFFAFMAKSTDEKMFDMMLQRKGLTKEELDALPPEKREKILKEIKEDIEREIREKSGILGSGTEDVS